ncbi:helix-turn-helix domain-containing protein [Brevibacillus sp. SAFN-007a]|uniref:helix-turn-helix domain-containing protein n=1 Tax=Brevibacillus sp. SAFN-007a TaxID=3436862 RepID=UPI003F804BE5
MFTEEIIGEWLLAYRQRENLSLNELAERTGISKTALSRIESGATKRLGFAQWKKIARALNIPEVDAIAVYLSTTERPMSIQVLLNEAIALNSQTLVRKAAQKLLDTPKMDTFLALDYLHQLAKETENPSIKLALHEVMIDFTRKCGIPFYLGKSLYARYLLERDDFSRFEETFQRGKELLHYIDLLQPLERIDYYYRMGVHAYILDNYGESIELCKKALMEDRTNDSRQKASALISVVNAYLRLGYLILAEQYLEMYEKSEYADFRKKHLRALLHAKKGEYEQAIALYNECLREAKPSERITIASDLLDVYFKTEQNGAIQELIATEDTFLSVDTHPNRIKHAARYFKQKGICLISMGQEEEGIHSLMQSIGFYRQIGAAAKMIEGFGTIFTYHLASRKNISVETVENLVKICHNSLVKE